MSDNIAVLDGFTREVAAESDACSLCLLVKPETDFDDAFKAWDMEAQEYIRVNGWLFIIEDVQSPQPGDAGFMVR